MAKKPAIVYRYASPLMQAIQRMEAAKVIRPGSIFDWMLSDEFTDGRIFAHGPRSSVTTTNGKAGYRSLPVSGEFIAK